MNKEKLKALLQQEANALMTEDEVSDARSGDYGQYDDTFDAGVDNGRAELATEMLAILFPSNP